MDGPLRALQETALFATAVVRTALRSVRENSGLAVLSVVLAFGIWIFVTDAENPARTRVLPVDLTPLPVRVPPDVAVAGELSPVRVRVTVAEDVFDSLTPADFEATVDLDGLTVGEYELPVEVRPLTSRGGLRVEAVLPETIDVRLSQLTNKSVPVVVEVTGSPPSGFTMGEPGLDDETAIVSGPQEQVDQVTQVMSAIDIEARTETVDQAVRLTARDSRGILVPGVTVDPALTGVRIEIEQQKFSRSVAVSPNIVGEPAEGYNVVGVSVNPAAVTIRGERAFIEGTASVSTKPVSIANQTGDVVRTVSLDLPSGSEVTGGVPVVTVTVRIRPAQGVQTFSVPVSAANLSDNVAIQGSLPSVAVRLFGPLPRLNGLSPSDIAATVDLGGRSAGGHRIQVRVTAPAELVVQSVSPAEIDVVLVNR